MNLSPNINTQTQFDGHRRSRALYLLVMLLLALALAWSAALTPVVRATTFTVTDCGDTVPGGAAGQLRKLISDATGGDTINIPAGCTITLAGAAGDDANATGDLDITKTLTINGAGAGTSIVDGGGNDRVFHLLGAVNLTISGLTIRNGRGPGFGDNGGGILNSGGTLTVSNSTLFNNSGASGGGIYNDGRLTVLNSTIVSNTAGMGGGGIGTQFNATTLVSNTSIMSNTSGIGGGIFNENGGVFTLMNSTVSNNQSGGQGGGMETDGTAIVIGSSVVDNAAGGNAGGLYSHGSLTVTSSSVMRNRAAADGGGIYNNLGAPLVVTNSLIVGNSAVNGGGIGYNSTGDGRIVNSLLAGNSATTGNGAGIHVSAAANVVIVFTTIASPTVSAKQAINVVSGTLGITDTIVTNHTTGLQNAGGAVYENYNLFFANATNKTGTIGGGANDVMGDPAFVAPASGDYHIGAGSAAIDAGVDVGVLTDFDGDVRPQGGGFDIGYDERIAAANVALTSVSISGPTTGVINTSYGFTATVAPLNATTPITYAWQATDQNPTTNVGGVSNTVNFSWTTASVKTVSVSASNSAGASVTATWTITIGAGMQRIYLPIVLKGGAQPPPPTFTVEINQALGQHSGRYVAGKDTAILVYLANAITVDPNQQSVVVKRGGTTVTTLSPQRTDQPTQVLTFLCPNRQACGDWQAGTYSFDVTINGALSSVSNIGFLDRKALRVLAVPVKANFGGAIKAVTSDDWKVAGDFILKVYPIAPSGYQWQLGQELDTSQFDINTRDGQRDVWQALANLQPMECTANPSASNCFDKIIGFVAERPGGMLNGYTWGAPANVVAIQSGMKRTVAHEVGHNYGLGDEYDGLAGAFRCDVNPTPPNYVGKDWYNRANTNFRCVNSTTQGFEEGDGSGVRVIAAQAHPFEIGGRGLIANDLGNFMGNYGDVSKAWVSPDAWKQVFDQLAPAQLSMARPRAAPYRVVEASGFISRTGGVTLQPWFSFTTTEVIRPISSTYKIEAVNAVSATLASQGFELTFDVFDEPPIDSAPFDVALPFPADTAAFKIISGTQVLKVLPVSRNAPVVSVTAPTAGLLISGVYTITWNASDLDGDRLYFDVEYNESADPNGWLFLATGITATRWTEDFSTLPGGHQARIRVTATDGINATVATSALFTVPARAPDVFIDEPLPGASYKRGTAVALEGGAYDYQDGWLFSDTQLTWRSSRDGVLGGGELLIVDNLSLGQHTLSLSATNSLGLTGVATTTLTINP